ncbi:MAG: methionine biosynthesis protein MetW [Pseudomonadales bacterium]|nr:methionine biosynthesis protein MetW [Pseudomonadales bacterium]
MSPELEVIEGWVNHNAHVLDLGCGDGSLLRHLKSIKQATGYGLESGEDNILKCIEAGVSVIEQDLNKGLKNFKEQSFDLVIMTQALQEISSPHIMLAEMLRIGKECIITFPNFGYWRNRSYLALRGRMPMSKTLPHAWYNTPNIHLCTFKDFEALCYRQHIKILDRTVVDLNYKNSWSMRIMPNLFGATAVYRVTK